MQEDAAALLVRGVIKVMRHLGMVDDTSFESQISNSETKSKSKPNKTAHSAVATTVLTRFEWLYTKHEGIWYPKVAPGDLAKKGQEIGTVGDLFGDTLEKIVSPVNGVILFLTINPSVLENGLLMGVGAK
jgi:predicted deacylase